MLKSFSGAGYPSSPDEPGPPRWLVIWFVVVIVVGRIVMLLLLQDPSKCQGEACPLTSLQFAAPS
jgi:hypothetical protein